MQCAYVVVVKMRLVPFADLGINKIALANATFQAAFAFGTAY
jgi:hypothetical protein